MRRGETRQFTSEVDDWGNVKLVFRKFLTSDPNEWQQMYDATNIRDSLDSVRLIAFNEEIVCVLCSSVHAFTVDLERAHRAAGE
jgi:hypothetical protein